jgi:hypothetical protein
VVYFAVFADVWLTGALSVKPMRCCVYCGLLHAAVGLLLQRPGVIDHLLAEGCQNLLLLLG